ncbi:MAG: serine/threonine-protein kinase [Polyangiaceae bacterium]
MSVVEGDVSAEVSVPAVGELLEGTPYHALSLLGEGGMGQVFDAEHRALGHRVVVKLLREDLLGKPEMLDRMRVEAQALARIRHPHLVMVTDFGRTAAGRPFIVMERLNGCSLREELAQRPVIPVEEAAEIGRQILLGLSAAHDAGLVHRDIKPDNIFLCATRDGRPFVKVLDFGVVKIAQAGRDPRTPQPLVLPTGDNISMGTPRYFSPEQARGERDLDARSDVYAVGLVLYVMLVGHGPFDHYLYLEQIFRAHATELPFPPIATDGQIIPSELNAIVMRALAKPREERFPDAVAFADALSRFLTSLGDAGRRFTASVPVLIGAGDPPPRSRVVSDMRTESIPFAPSASDDPTATASPVVPAADPLRDKLPKGPVLIDNLVDRVLAGGPRRPPPASAPNSQVSAPNSQASAPSSSLASAQLALAPTAPALEGVSERAFSPPARALPATDPMAPISCPPTLPVSDRRPSVPETAPMFELPASLQPPRGQPSSPGPLSSPAAAPAPSIPPLPASVSTPVLAAAPSWRRPAILLTALLALAAAVALLAIASR